MGTRARFLTYATTRRTGLERLEVMLGEIETTDRQLSTWLPHSELSRLNRLPSNHTLSLGTALCTTFRSIAYWRRETAGAFDPAVGALIEVWGLRGNGAWPSDARLAAARAASGFDRLAFDADGCTIARTTGVTIDAGAFGKGDALDRARAAVEQSDAPWLIDLGGQIAVGGHPPRRDGWAVGIAHPARRHERALTLALTHGSIAVSGGSERDLVDAGRRIGHVLDPRTGRPAPFGGSLVVWHADAMAADVLSTALYVMGPVAGVAWANARGVAAAFLEVVPTPRGRESLRIDTTDVFDRRFGAPELSLGLDR